MKLDDLLEELEDLTPEERLEWIVEFGNELPAISANRQSLPFPETCRVQECQTPVYLWVEQNPDGTVHLEADVPRKSPVVRGLVAVVVCGLDGESAASIRAIPDDLMQELGLVQILGMTRQQGLRGVIGRIKHQLREGAPGER